jgi:cytochrome c-type biogenesis protein CcmH/NrfG
VAKRPSDYKALFDLGSLYFESGRYAQGLQVYEKLKNVQDPRSGELLSYYSEKGVV